MISYNPVQLLSARQLIDEYESLLRLVTLAADYHDRGCKTAIPQHYTLSSHHYQFFYNKLGWCEQRFLKVVHELRFRGIIFPYEVLPHVADHLPTEWWQDWDPTTDVVTLGRPPKRK
jgi:hypothetical protein